MTVKKLNLINGINNFKEYYSEEVTESICNNILKLKDLVICNTGYTHNSTNGYIVSYFLQRTINNICCGYFTIREPDQDIVHERLIKFKFLKYDYSKHKFPYTIVSWTEPIFYRNYNSIEKKVCKKCLTYFFEDFFAKDKTIRFVNKNLNLYWGKYNGHQSGIRYSNRLKFLCKSSSLIFERNDRKCFDSLNKWLEFTSEHKNIRFLFGKSSKEINRWDNKYTIFIKEIKKILDNSSLNLNLSSEYKLVPINIRLKYENKKAYQIYLRNREENWYKKLLEDFSNNINSKNKNEITDDFYRSQAKLHGLKFVRK